jgi:hypothetical protein
MTDDRRERGKRGAIAKREPLYIPAAKFYITSGPDIGPRRQPRMMAAARIPVCVAP